MITFVQLKKTRIMKKLLFVLAFAFMSQQAFSQMYVVIVSSVSSNHPSGCPSSQFDRIMTVFNPSGNISYTCLPSNATMPNNEIQSGGENVKIITQQFNNLISQGYKMLNTSTSSLAPSYPSGTWYFAIP